MKLKTFIQDTFYRLVKWVSETNWLAFAHRVSDWVGRVMHKVVFGWLLPKKYRSLTKREIFDIIFKSDTPAGKRFDVALLILIVLNIALLMVDSVWGSSDTITSRHWGSWAFWVAKLLEWGFTLLFTVEYYLRIYCLNHPRRYVLSLWGIIDFLSIFPAYLSLLFPATQALSVLRLLRVMRIFRIFKLDRFQGEMVRLMNIMRRSAVKIMVFMLFVFVVAVILGTVVYALEADHNPDMGTIPTGIYWAVVTITTVGYGDVAPVTTGGRFLAMVVMLLGYSILAVSSGIVAGETIVEHKKPAPKRRRSAVESDYDDDQRRPFADDEEEAIHN